jgi:sensor histidine kinase YesM
MFDVRWNIDEKLLDIEIPKNILQPLVENALYHGVLANKDENGDIIGGYITITAKESDGHITLSVRDNGIGMPQAIIDEVMKSENGALGNNTLGEHIGLCNILARLRYLHKNEFIFIIESKEGMGTEITIKFKIKLIN